MRRHEDIILTLSSIIITVIVIYQLQEFYIEYATYFGWITLFVVHIIVVWMGLILVTGKIKQILKLK